jgi:hypothetical protein
MEVDIQALSSDVHDRFALISTSVGAGTWNKLIEKLGQIRFVVNRLEQYRGLSALIVWFFPKIFAEFRAKQFSLLWRGSCNSFG